MCIKAEATATTCTTTLTAKTIINNFTCGRADAYGSTTLWLLIAKLSPKGLARTHHLNINAAADRTGWKTKSREQRAPGSSRFYQSGALTSRPGGRAS